MASINYSKRDRRWRVVVYLGRVDGKSKLRAKSFLTRGEAEQYAADAGLTIGTRGGRQRNAEQVVAFIADNSALDDDGCMVWQRNISNAGYGQMNWKPGKGQAVISGAHRLIYHLTVEPVQVGKVIDHLCRNRACVRPDHLEMVQQRENVMRSPIAPGALNAAKTHCAQGHEYTPENTYTYTFKTKKTTTRICRTCSRAHHARYAERKRVQRLEQAVA